MQFKNDKMAKKTCRFITLSFSFIFWFYVRAFSNEVDSLKKVLSTHINDTTRVDVLNSLSKVLSHTNLDSSILIANEAKKLAEKVDYKPGLALAWKNIGMELS